MSNAEATELVMTVWGNWSQPGTNEKRKLWRSMLLDLDFAIAKKAVYRLVMTCEEPFWPAWGVFQRAYDAQLADQRREQQAREKPQEEAWTPMERQAQMAEAQQMIQRLAAAKRMP